MKKIIINKEVNVKWLTLELLAAGLNVSGVGVERNENEAFVSAYAEIDETDEVAVLAIIEAHDPENTPDILEQVDLQDLAGDITNELDWITGALTEIDNGLAAVGAFTNATQRAIVMGLLQNQRRLMLQQRRELKAWRYVVRRLGK